ncbi:MAG TPA: hypothetical protein VGU20_26905 [Stellaceae bacterium]|nr:hypothetical protein [Stellaceae bacterium]
MSNAANPNLAPMTGGHAPDAAGLRAGLGRELVMAASDEAPDTVIYFAHGYEADAARTLAAKAHLENTYIATGTPIVVASRRSLRELDGFGSLLRPAQ